MIPCLRANQTKFNIPLKKKQNIFIGSLIPYDSDVCNNEL